MINVIISGCSGKMGQVISDLIGNDPDMQVTAGFDINGGVPTSAYPVFTKPMDCNVDADVIIDFSIPDALDTLLEYAVFRKTPLVIATTGISELQRGSIAKASAVIPIFQSSNMSIGTNLVIDLISKAVKILEGFDIEIVEKHHNQKIDAPSGTAIMLADAINMVLDEKHEYIYDRHLKRDKRGKQEIGIHSIRGGTIVGEHSVIFAGNDEIVEIKHVAMSRNIFGRGALKAAKYIINKNPGLYNMKTLISEE